MPSIVTCGRALAALAVLAGCLAPFGRAQPADGTVCSIAGAVRASGTTARPDTARDHGSGGEGVIVAVLDTGIDGAHPALAGKVVASVNFSESANAADINGHGTHVAGIIAGGSDPGGTTVGVAPGCRLLDVKVAADDGAITTEAVVNGICWAADHGADIINISLTVAGSAQLEAAVGYAWERGAVIIASAGNSYTPVIACPASYADVVAVAAGGDGGPERWSNRGPWVDLVAPGSDIYSALPGDRWGYRSGTSMAAAAVSGRAAVLAPITPDRDGDGRVNTEIVQSLLAGR
jgi:thermitase